MDWLKELVLPSNIAALLFVLGILLYAIPRRRQYSWWLLSLSGAMVLVFSSGTVAALLLSRLEYSYPSLLNPGRYPQADTIVVLTAYAADDPRMPLSSRNNTSGTYRMLEAANLYHFCQNCRVVVTGYPVAARLMGTLLQRIGVPPAKLQIEMDSPNTEASAINLQNMLGDKAFFLVTSAGHMPRAMQLFEQRGMNPIAAPTDFKMPKQAQHAPIWPNPEHLQYSDLAIHEYLAMFWYKLRDSFSNPTQAQSDSPGKTDSKPASKLARHAS